MTLSQMVHRRQAASRISRADRRNLIPGGRQVSARRWWMLGFFTLILLLSPRSLRAHGLTVTQVIASFERPGQLEVTFEYDLSNFLPSSDAYHALSLETHAHQKTTVDRLLPEIEAGLQLYVGETRLQLELLAFTVPTLSRADFDDPGKDKFTVLKLRASLPSSRDPLRLYVPYGAKVDYPVIFVTQVPSANVQTTSWIDDGTEQSEPFNWAFVAIAGSSVAQKASPNANVSSAPTPSSSPRAQPPEAPSNDRDISAARGPQLLDPKPWYGELATYLRLGFRHIVPEGADHILFVLGLFFLGLTWRKLLSQTTVFTIAHATTLALSSYGIFSLPGWLVEPLIALSIAFIALENVVRPQLGIGRLAVVFAFGLIHGLGFASSLSEIPFPRNVFFFALVGFNFGVDLGQLFVIGVAFLAVGWFRRRAWFRSRIAIPCSLAIAAVGVFWCIQRIIFFSRHG